MAEIVVHLDPESPELALTLRPPPEGATARWVKEELCRQDPTGAATPESFCLCAQAWPSQALEDGAALADGTVLLLLDGEAAVAAEEAANRAREAAEAERWAREEAEREAAEAERWASEEAQRREREAAEAQRRAWEEEEERKQREAAEAAEAERRAWEEEEERKQREAAEAAEAERRAWEEEERKKREAAEARRHEAETARQRARDAAERRAKQKPLTETEKRALEGQRIAIIVHGSRGDLQPFLSLCLGLLACKPRPALKVFTDKDHCASLRQFGIECAQSVERSTQRFLQSKRGVRAMTEGDIQIAFDEADNEEDKEDQEDDWWERQGAPQVDWVKEVHRGLDSFGATLLIYNDLCRHYARTYSMTRDVPAIRVLLQPHGIPSNDVVPMEVQRRLERDPDTPVLRLWIMVIQWNCEGYLHDEHLQPEVPIRETPESCYDMYFRIEDAPEPVLCAYSEELWPAPPDWPTRNVEITGGWKISKQEQTACAAKGTSFFDEGQHKRCAEFLKAGKPPVYMGWGSMMVHSAEYMTRLAVASLRAAGQRGIVLVGWAGLSPGCLPTGSEEARQLRDYCSRNVLFLKAAPHEWLFPQCSCAVHHGGIGTAQASLGAGLPTVITPVFCDQFDIGEHVAKIEVGFKTDQLAHVTAEEVGKAIRACCEEPRYLANAKRLAEHMGKEDGVGRTCDLLRRFIAGELRTGKWKRKHLEYKEALRVRRREAQHVDRGQMFKTPAWTVDLRNRYPVLANYWDSQDRLFHELEHLAGTQRLWYVKAPSCLVRREKAFGSAEVGRFLEFALLEELEREGSRLRARRRKGVGPDEGWVSTAVPGKEIVAKIDSVPRLWEVMGLYDKQRHAAVRLGKRRR